MNYDVAQVINNNNSLIVILNNDEVIEFNISDIDLDYHQIDSYRQAILFSNMKVNYYLNIENECHVYYEFENDFSIIPVIRLYTNTHPYNQYPKVVDIEVI